MKKSMRILTLLLALIMLLSTFAIAMTSCGNKEPQETQKGTDPAGTGPTGSDPSTNGKTQYTVCVKTIGGRAISDLTFHIYRGDDLTAYGTTDENGIGTVSLAPADDYSIELSAASLEGYDVQDRYSFDGVTANIVLTSSIIMDTDITGVQYELGDIIHDFEVMTTDGSTFKLSEALKTKKAVLINFWYSTCNPCISEFPHMQSAYEKYSDTIEVIALNNYAADNENTIKDFKATMGLTFPVAKDYSTLYDSFLPLVKSIYNGQTGYPTSIMIDRYGTICLVELGGLTSEKPFVAAFEHFSAENYQQKLFNTISELTPVEKPNIEMPSSEEISAALNGSNFTATYAPETEADDAEYSWPFIIGAKDGVTCIYPSNAKKDSSFATLHATVELAKDEALAIDYFSSTEENVDILYILVDGKDIIQISGVRSGWSTCYPFVADQAGTYEVSFIYVKDSGTDTGDDVVYLKNFRKVAVSDITAATYIPRQAATNPNANGLGYQSYITPVFNEADGYYHVGKADGPILMVDLMGSTQLSETSLNLHGYNGKLMDGNVDLYETLVDYCNYAINGMLYGYCPVTDELKEILIKAADIVGVEENNPNEWLQACSYYSAYGTNEQLPDPVKGVAFFAAFDTVLSTDTEEKLNTVTYDGRVLMPRGLKYKFVPAVSGAYIIKSQSDNEVNGWIFDDKYEIIHTASVVDRPYGDHTIDSSNVSMIIYLEANKTYYIDIAYYDVYAAGTFTFTVKYLAESYEHFHLASPGYFTYTESATGQVNETIAGGINVKLGDDGYYHELRADGTLGSIVYADFIYATDLFSHSISRMIELGGFNFSVNDTDQQVLAKLKELDGDKDACRNYYKNLWQDAYDEWAEIWKLEEVLAGKYHGNGEDLTDEISVYLDQLLPKTDEAPELEGCIAVDEDLAALLQKLVDKYSFSGVTNSWTKLCYYYKHVGA